MVKASLTLPNGTTIQIDGDQKELEQLLKVFATTKTEEVTRDSDNLPKKKKKSAGNGTRSKKGPMAFVLEQKSKDFFTKQKRTVGDVKTQLDTEGHFFTPSALAVTLLRLVSKGELRRIKQDGTWLYTTSDTANE